MIRDRTWHTDRFAWLSVATGAAVMLGAGCIALAFEGYEGTELRGAGLLRLRVPLFLGGAVWGLIVPMAVTIGQWLDGRASRPMVKKKVSGLEDL
jgi:hypothetical protein